jgi:hypothetical protein
LPPGVIDYPRQRSVVDPFAGLEVARKIEEGGIVLLKNKTGRAAAERPRGCTPSRSSARTPTWA